MVFVDGSYGEGGGQVLRTSLALSLVEGKAFQIRNIRAGRKKPGLMRQHLAAVNAAAEIGKAKLEGNFLGSNSLTFAPERIGPGTYRFAVGSAGSCTLVFQTVLPALLIADGPSNITLEGGTHNPFAPPFDFIQKAFLPVLNRMGPRVDAALERPGFFPAGGGRFRAAIQPAAFQRIDLTERGRLIRRAARACVARLPVTIARRELKVVREELDFDRDSLEAVEVTNSRGPGNILTIEIESENISEVFTGFGEKGIPAETVAERTAAAAREYLASIVPVARQLADQILIPMALAGGGRFRTLSPTGHTKTNIEIIKKFIDVEITAWEYARDRWEVAVSS